MIGRNFLELVRRCCSCFYFYSRRSRRRGVVICSWVEGGRNGIGVRLFDVVVGFWEVGCRAVLFLWGMFWIFVV